MGIEPTTRVQRVTGFEDQGSHQAPFTSRLQFTLMSPQAAHITGPYRDPSCIEMLHQRHNVFSRRAK